MKKRIAALAVALVIALCAPALAEAFHLAPENERNFGMLLIDLLHAYEKPSSGDEMTIASAIEAIDSVRAEDGELARAIAEQWRIVYLDQDYPLYLYGGSDRAIALEQSSLSDSDRHAFVVLGYELRNGEMADELIGRCQAAAAAARSFPSAIIVCSGGPTGKNNPDQHTEAGLMRDYLVQDCGIDASRIFIDERALSTVQNAVNTFEILKGHEIESFTLVTSSYHQRWAQVIYRAMAEVCRQTRGYTAAIMENYSFAVEPSERYRRDDIMALRQLTSILQLSDEVIEAMKQAY